MRVSCLSFVWGWWYLSHGKDSRRDSAILQLSYWSSISSSCSVRLSSSELQARQYDFHPFWSYSRPDLLVENIMNVVVFIPVGLLLGIAFKQMTWWKALLIGCSISITIEALQFWFMKGFSEVDDVMHNTVGCLLGWFMVKGSWFRV